MTFEEFLHQYLFILAAQFQWDISVMSTPWMYYPLMIPIALFLAFFMVKWMVLLSPVWLLVGVVSNVLLRFLQLLIIRRRR